MINYNNKNQAYTIINRFWIVEDDRKETEYCRIKFLLTNHSQVVKSDILKVGDFEDQSLIEEIEVVKPVVKKVIEAPVIEEVKETVEKPDPVIIVTTPKGTDIEVTDLEKFCKSKNLDLVAVESVLEGKQKTHRKYKFKYAE